MRLIGYDHAELHRARPKNVRCDLRGVAVYYKSHMANYMTLIKLTEDYMLWIKHTKEYTNYDKDIFICISYSVLPGSEIKQLTSVV